MLRGAPVRTLSTVTEAANVKFVSVVLTAEETGTIVVGEFGEVW